MSTVHVCVFESTMLAPVAPERIWKWGSPVQSKSGGHRSGSKRRKFFLLVVPLHFLALKAQVVLVSAFMMVSTVCSVYCLLSLLFAVLLTVPPRALPFVKVGGTCPPVPHGVGATGWHY